jgi:isopenicillin-N N-acyltransferase like protein
MVERFRHIEISGNAKERGEQHGRLLKAEIKETIEYYRSIFKLSDALILKRAGEFRTLINTFNSEYLVEMDAIAEAANVDPLWIVALNARTEILSTLPSPKAVECTSVCFSDQALLGQNWDWASRLESLLVFMQITQPDGHRIGMVTEPGILGKIGMNSQGIGVCLNILATSTQLDGLPVHIVLRSILDCKNMLEVKKLLADYGAGKASHVLVATDKGEGFGYEFFQDKYFQLDFMNNHLIHTNHYLGDSIDDPSDPDFRSSFSRIKTARQFMVEHPDQDLTIMKEFLTDESDSDWPIYRHYIENDHIGDVGTVCSIIMDLKEQEIHLRKGKSELADFKTYRLTD